MDGQAENNRAQPTFVGGALIMTNSYKWKDVRCEFIKQHKVLFQN